MIKPWMFKASGLQPETIVYRDLMIAEGTPLSGAEVAALDAEIKSIKSGTPLTLSSLTLNLSLVSGAYFITRASTDLNRYSGISGVQYSVAATGTPATTAVYSGAITAGTGETEGSDILAGWNFTSGWTATGGVDDLNTFHGRGVYKNIAINGFFLRGVFSCTSEATSAKLSDGYGSPTWGSKSVSSGYGTATIGQVYVVTSDVPAGTKITDVTQMELYQILTPSALGFTASTLTNGGINANSATYVVTVSKP